MSVTEDFLARLDIASPQEREAIYSSSPLPLTRDQVHVAFDTNRPCGRWLAFRFEAGPPGLELPTLEEALERVLSTRTGTPAEAYRLIFASAPLPVDTPTDLVLPLLINATACALSKGTTFFATWLAARAGLAAIALGQPELAFSRLDLLTIQGRRHPNLQPLEVFEPLRDHDGLLQDPWVRAAICHRWPFIGIPLIPALPFPPRPDRPASHFDTLKALDRISAHEARSWVESYVLELDRRLLAQHADHPLVRDLRARAMRKDHTAPETPTIPDGFFDWAKATRRQGDHRLARLAGLTLWQADRQQAPLAATLVLNAARSSDLELLRTGLPNELTEMFEELESLRDHLPPEVCDALLAISLPDHVDASTTPDILARHIDILSALPSRPDGVLAHAVRSTKEMLASDQAQRPEPSPEVTAIARQIARATQHLTTSGLPLDQAALEHCANTLQALPTSRDKAFVAEAHDIASTKHGLERLLFSLVLLKQLDTPNLAEWRSMFARLGAFAMDETLARRMPGLHLRLLDIALADPSPSVPTARPYRLRASARLALGLTDRAQVRLAIRDLDAALIQARVEADPFLLAEVTAYRTTTLITVSLQHRLDLNTVLPDAERDLAEALELPIDGFSRATLLHARAHLRRMTDSTRALTDLEDALALVATDAPFWTQLAAEVVQTMVRLGQTREAAERGVGYLKQTTADQPASVLGMLHLAVGDALLIESRPAEARSQFETALRISRGTAFNLEAQAHQRLAQLCIGSGVASEAGEHLRFLRAHRDQLDPTIRHDLDQLEAYSASTHQDFDTTRTALSRAIGSAPNERDRISLELKLARLDIDQGRTIQALVRLLERAFTANLDPRHGDILADLLCNSRLPLSESTRTRAKAWALEAGRASVSAHLCFLAGEPEEGAQRLRAALETELPVDERIRCLHLLVKQPDLELDEQRHLTTELEACLGDRSLPTVRLDLAAVLVMSNRGDRPTLERARNHVRRAFESPIDDRAREYGTRTLARITVDSLQQALPLSSPALAQEASWLLEPHPLPQAELAELRAQAAERLIATGPLTHPGALSIAEQLFAAALGHPVPKALDALGPWLRWVRNKLDGVPSTPSSSAQLSPLDAIPQALVDLVQGHQRPVSIDELQTFSPFLELVVRARPDAADRVLATAIALQHKLSRANRSDLLDALYSAVQSVANVAQLEWPQLRAALEDVRKKRRHPTLDLIRAATDRSSRSSTRKNRPNPSPRGAAPNLSDRDRALACFEEGVSLLESIHHDPFTSDAATLIARSRQLLETAVTIARTKKLPMLFDFLVSWGNAWKASPNADLDKALALYGQAAPLRANPEQRAKLWKVHADALISRGGDDDLRQADKLLERACRHRSGNWLAATLWSRAHLTARHPDLDALARLQRATELAMDAIRMAPPEFDQGGVIHLLLVRLAAWTQLQPEDTRPNRIRQELKTLYPHRAKKIDTPIVRPSTREIATVVALMTHPAGQAYWHIRSRLMSPDELDHGSQLISHLGPSAISTVQTHTLSLTLHGRPDEAERFLRSLSEGDGPELPGLLTGKVLLTAHLARLGRLPATDVIQPTHQALATLDRVDDPHVRSALMRELATVLSPNDPNNDPVCDFTFAVTLLRRCVELEGGEDRALGDTLGFLARALRYAPNGDRAKNLREARRLYELLLARRRASGSPDLIATCLHNLAEVETQIARGPRLARHQRAERLLKEAVELAASPRLKARFMASLAWEQTQIGTLQQAEGRPQLEAALATYDRIDTPLLDDDARRHLEGQRQICLAALAKHNGGRAAEIESLRATLAMLPPDAPPYQRALLQHNLGTALVSTEDLTRETLTEGLLLLTEAAQTSTIRSDPSHHWESALAIGAAILYPILTDQLDLLPVAPSQALAAAQTWLLSAANAARILGPGEELLDTTLLLCELATYAPTHELLATQAEEAWSFIRDASAYLLVSPHAHEREASAATRIAAALANRLTTPSPSDTPTDHLFVIEGEHTALIKRWLIRSQGPAKHTLRARLSRPASFPASAWESWRQALDSRDPDRIASELEAIRTHTPTFLREDHSDEQTWRWLEARPGSVAVTLVLAHPRSLALVMRADTARHTTALTLEIPEPPESFADLSDLLRHPNRTPQTAKNSHDAIVDWLRVHAITPIIDHLGAEPTAVLWAPGPILRNLAPSAVWRDVPVAVTTSLALSDRLAPPGRRQSSLIALADPGKNHGHLNLGTHGLPALDTLREAAKARGPVRLLASVGAQFGRSLLAPRDNVRDTPASALDILREVAEHEVIVLLAHGEVDTLEDAALLGVDAEGRIDRLDVTRLASAPDAFAGATVVLLSCESGRMKESLSDPGGLAGTLLSAGARCVVAPLWPVQLDIATQVGAELLKGMASSSEPWAVLSKLHPSSQGESPSLGRPPAPPAERRAQEALHRLAFVAWLG